MNSETRFEAGANSADPIPPAPLLEIESLRKRFRSPEGTARAVVAVEHFAMAPGVPVALRGESGSGKTTFLNLIAGIVKPDAGRIILDGCEITACAEARRDRLRALEIGFIFQSFNLLQGYTCLENVLLGMAFGPGEDRRFAEALLGRVGLGERLDYYPRQLSSGQQQRVSVARALANRPKLVLADEPTGNLDRRNARAALALIREACRESGAALLLVSHAQEVMEEFERVEDFELLNRAGASGEEGA